MGIFTRCMNLFKADIHGVMDQLEDKGLLLKQCLRDMEDALAEKQDTLNHAVLRQEKCLKESENSRRDIEKLDQDITAAIKKDRDDIARLLIRKSSARESHRDALLRHIESLEQDIARLRECIDAQKIQYEQIKLQTDTFFREKAYKKMENPGSSFSPSDPVTGFGSLSEEEVELALMNRRDAINGGNNV